MDRLDIDRTAGATVAAIGGPFRNKFLTEKRNASVSAGSGSNGNCAEVGERRISKDVVGMRFERGGGVRRLGIGGDFFGGGGGRGRAVNSPEERGI